MAKQKTRSTTVQESSITLNFNDIDHYLNRGTRTFADEYNSSLKEGQERYLLEGMAAILSKSDEDEILIFQAIRNAKERITIAEPFYFFNLMEASAPSAVVFEIHKHYALNYYIGYDNGLSGFDEELEFKKKINTSAIRSHERVNHFLHTISDDIDEFNHEADEVGKTYCPICEREMVIREGKWGRFFGCSKYPRCRGTRQING